MSEVLHYCTAGGRGPLAGGTRMLLPVGRTEESMRSVPSVYSAISDATLSSSAPELAAAKSRPWVKLQVHYLPTTSSLLAGTWPPCSDTSHNSYSHSDLGRIQSPNHQHGPLGLTVTWFVP